MASQSASEFNVAALPYWWKRRWLHRKGVFTNAEISKGVFTNAELSKRMSVPLSKLQLDLEGLDKLIDWKVYGWLGIKEARERGEHTMQTQVTIELRCDFEDKDKVAVLIEAAQAAARHMLATASLLSDKVKPQIVVFTDDFFTGHKEIPLIGDTIAQGETMIAGESDLSELSDELTKALKG